MSVWVIELSHNHHTVWETYVKVWAKVWDKPVSGIISKYNWGIIRKGECINDLSRVVVVGKTTDRCMRCAKNRWLFFMQTLYENIVMNTRYLIDFLGIKKDDVIVFPTLDAHINPHANVLFRMVDTFRKKGAFIVGTLHNTDLYGAKGYDYIPDNLASWHNRYRWYLWKKWMNGQRWSDKIDLLVTCSQIEIPKDMVNRHIVIPSRLAEEVYDWESESVFRVAITGSMSENRLNWDYILYLLDSLSELPKAEIAFLGKIPDSRYEYLKGKYGDKVVLFRHFVEESTFKEILRKTHVIVTPLVDRRYGIYTISGSIEADALAYGIPSVAPSFYKSIPSHLLFGYFDSKESLVDTIYRAYNMWNEGGYSSYRKNILKENRRFSVDAISYSLRRKVVEVYENSHNTRRW